MGKPTICIGENKGADHYFDQFLYFLNPKFPASNHLLWLYSPVCVRPGRNPNCWFSHTQAHILVGLSLYLSRLSPLGFLMMTFEPSHEKTNNLGFQRSRTQTSQHSHRSRLKAWNFRFRKKRGCTICVAKTKALISCAVTASLIWHMQIVGFLMQWLIYYFQGCSPTTASYTETLSTM